MPGPADYDPKKPAKKTPRLDPTPIPGKGRLYMCRTPYTHGISAPSIPTRIDENGYTVNTNGDILKALPDDHDTTLGPAYYDAPQVIAFITVG